MSDTIPVSYSEQLRAFVKTLTSEQANVILNHLQELTSAIEEQDQPSPQGQTLQTA